MDQDELEEEIFTKTIGVHLKLLSDYIRHHSVDLNSMFVISHRREFFMYFLAVLIAVFMWLIYSGVLAKRFSGFDFISNTIGNQVWQETEKSGGASVYSLQGRRPTMEDRFVITESLPPVIDNVSPKLKESNSFPDLQRRQSIKIYGVFDGHGGEFAASYVKKHLTKNLSVKIKLLQLLLQEKFVEKEKLISEYERISRSPATSDVLKYLGISKPIETKSKPPSKDSTPKEDLRSSDSPKRTSISSKLAIKDITEANVVSSNEKQEENKSTTEAKPTLVLSSRVKPIEELVAPEIVKQKVQERKKEDIANANYIYNDLLSPYNDQSISTTKQRNSPSKQSQNGITQSNNRDHSCKRNHLKGSDKETNTKKINRSEKIPDINNVTFKRDVAEYFLANNTNGDIDFPKLIRDEIAHVDQILVQESKKAMQIGGTTLLMAILDCSSSVLWVANIGDSRGVLCNSCSVPIGEVMPLSYDHKPSQLKERKRIEDAGGFIAMNGVWRVQGILATSRAMGDFPLKDKKVVTSEPDILSFRLKKMESEFAILASDGLWDTHSNEEAVNFIKAKLNDPISKTLSRKSKIENAAKSLALDSHNKGSTDNVTVMVLDFKNI